MYFEYFGFLVFDSKKMKYSFVCQKWKDENEKMERKKRTRVAFFVPPHHTTTTYRSHHQLCACGIPSHSPSSPSLSSACACIAPLSLRRYNLSLITRLLNLGLIIICRRLLSSSSSSLLSSSCS